MWLKSVPPVGEVALSRSSSRRRQKLFLTGSDNLADGIGRAPLVECVGPPKITRQNLDPYGRKTKDYFRNEVSQAFLTDGANHANSETTSNDTYRLRPITSSDSNNLDGSMPKNLLRGKNSFT